MVRSGSLDRLLLVGGLVKPKQLPQAPVGGLKRVKSSDAALNEIAQARTQNAQWSSMSMQANSSFAKPASSSGTNSTTSIRTAQPQEQQQGPANSRSMEPEEIDYLVANAQRASIRFSEGVRMRHIRHISDYPPDVIQDCWITNQEMAEIREKAQILVKLADTYPDMLEELGGIYGLEKHTKALTIQKQDNRTRSVGTVLGLQKISKSMPHRCSLRRFNPENFAAKMYFLQSAKAAMDAHVYARELHQELKPYRKGGAEKKEKGIYLSLMHQQL